MWPPLSFLEALPIANISCACIVEYFDSFTTVHHGCHSHLWTTTYPSTNDYFLHTMFRNITLWLDIHGCLSAASLSTIKKKGVVQLKAFWKKFVCVVLIVATLGLIITLLALYELMLIMQVHIETGIKGILLSLLPSFPLSALGWYLKKRSQKKASKSSNEKTLEQTAEEQQ